MIRARVDPILDTLLSYSIYTYVVFGYIVSALDYISQVLIVFMFTVYTVLKSRDDPNVANNFGYFLAGYFLGAYGVKAI